MADLGIRCEVLDAAALARADLTQLTTVVLDIRAYYHQEDLLKQRDRILYWCQGGGRVVCFYHKSREWSATDKKPLLAPYALRVGRQRVGEEDVPVDFIDPAHRLFHHPNRLGQQDFRGWVQERGLKDAEIGATIGVSERTVQRGWRMVRAWLSREMDQGGDRGGS